MKGIFLDAGVFKPHDFDEFHTLLDVWEIRNSTQPNEVVQFAQDADIILLNKVVMDRDTLSQLPKLKLLCVSATGIDNIDMEAAKEQGILVNNVVGYSTESVANLAISMMLSLTSRLQENREVLANGSWEQSENASLFICPPLDLVGKKLGIVGYGAIGKRVAQIAEAFQMEIVVAPSLKTNPDRDAFESFLKEVDILSLHCPSTPQTEGLIGEKELDLMPDHAILINVSRGKLVDSDALAKALEQNKIFGAGLDVLEKEPPPSDHPLLHLHHPRLILTPHIAWGSPNSLQNLVTVLKKQVREFVEKNN